MKRQSKVTIREEGINIRVTGDGDRLHSSHASRDSGHTSWIPTSRTSLDSSHAQKVMLCYLALAVDDVCLVLAASLVCDDEDLLHVAVVGLEGEGLARLEVVGHGSIRVGLA